MRKRVLSSAIIALCATALFFGMWAVAAAEDGPTTTTTTTTAGGGSTSSTSSTESTTTTQSTTTTTEDVQWWTVTSIDIAESGLVPSFISLSNGIIAWTGTKPGEFSNMYVYNTLTRTNSQVPAAFSGNYYNPSSDGALVVYQGGRAGGYDDIFMYDTGNGIVQQLTHNSDPGDGNDWNPRLDNGRVVWEKHMTGPGAKTGIYVYDMNEGSVTLIFAGDEYHDPDISGDYVVCVKNATDSYGTEIVLYNLKTAEVKTIAPSTKNNEHPRIDSGHVVWSSGDIPTLLNFPWETYQIELYSIAGDSTIALTDNKFGNFSPSIKDGVVAWEQAEPSGLAGTDFINGYQGLFNKGDPVKAPEVADGGSFAYYADKTLYYAWVLPNGPKFIDVGFDHPYATAINTMAEKEIIAGYEDGMFGPNDLVTRQQFAKMILLTMAQWKPSEYTATLHDSVNFVDADAIEHRDGELYAYHYVAKAASTGLTFGYPDGTFRPLDNISRQQVITMIVRAGSQVLETPPPSWQGVLSYVNSVHGERIRIAEYNGLLDGIVGGTWGGTSGWDTRLNATRGEVAQMLYNLLNKLIP